jgi:hypothetical protein
MENRVKCIPWIAHEEAMWLKDRVIKKWTAGTILMGVACVISNIVWMLKSEKG